ncbi:rabankyrin-5-like isoform X2 [Leptotrombidium deliense]|uniref:Rabankyrin-5-like isoform X2 n=1 Tax=Leptotrombidium deliense TaxID=299467 RepID=A0A443SKU1_9ACAR|nr:rabankyrin-5-like isoform X2 [Leptotrombidium deliense]
MESQEIEKLKKHLSLLKEEYVKLQSKYSDVERRYNVLTASHGKAEEDTFVCRLLKTIANLFDKELYSDLNILLQRATIKGHKFILSARGDKWGVDLSEVSTIDWTDIPHNIGYSLLKWVYTDSISLNDESEQFILDMMTVAKRFGLNSLVDKCEKSLMSFVKVENCVKFYQTADEIGAVNLRNHCSELISTHWDDFTGDDFVHMSAPLLFNMFKAKTEYPLHTAIRVKREDVVFLYLVEYDSQLTVKLNEMDRHGELPLDLALKSKQESIAKNLVSNRANVNAIDDKGITLLHKAILRKDSFSAKFLINERASVDISTSVDKKTPLHLLCSQEYNESMLLIAENLLDNGADPNLQDCNGNTCIHLSILARNDKIFRLLLRHRNITLEVRNSDGLSPLALALQCLLESEIFAKLLVEKGTSVDSSNPLTGDTLLHLSAKEKNEVAGIFLTTNGAKVNLSNNRGETALHIAAFNGLNSFVESLLKHGANCNATTSPQSYSDASSIEDNVYNQTPLHFAVMANQEEVIRTILKFKDSNARDLASSIIAPNLNIKDSREKTALTIAVEKGLHAVAQLLIDEGANVNIVDAESYSLLQRAIINGDSRGAVFLLTHGADYNMRTPENETPLQLAIKHQLECVVIDLCAKGTDMNVVDANGICPLWFALENENEDIASILVQYDCDTNFWSEGPGGCWQTLLHKALDENNEFIACFLIRSGCDVNSPRKPSPEGKGEEEAYDGQTPLHLACCWGLENVVQTLLEFGANVNIQDAEGKTPLHVAIINQHPVIISLLLSHPALKLDIRDKYGSTPFATAMTIKNNKAAQAILDRDSNAAEKFDGKGRNFLHLAIQKGDIESVLFLLSINVNIHSKVQDNSQLSPLHLAVEVGSEMIVRNLLLAGANVNDLTVQKQTPLHIAAEHDHHTICSILIENGVKFDAVDVNLNNALHVACQKGNLAACKVLLSESTIKAEAINLRGQNPLHLLAQHGKENAAAIFELFIQSMPDYPINKPDAEGNTPLFLAYSNGNANLCRSLVRSNACLGSCNRHGVNIFNCQVASKNLLYRLLDYLPQESPWADGDQCLECGLKFGLTNRKHHCRHCGRIVCAKCSSREITILKFNVHKPARVCGICFDVLSNGFQC